MEDLACELPSGHALNKERAKRRGERWRNMGEIAD
jgi:hypothetical protein